MNMLIQIIPESTINRNKLLNADHCFTRVSELKDLWSAITYDRRKFL